MSSPVVCGIGAMYFQRYPNASWADFKAALLGCAEEDAFTGSNLPDNIWGYGKANAYNTIRNCLVGMPGITAGEGTHRFFPNPVADHSFFQYDFQPATGSLSLAIFNAVGQKVSQRELPGYSGEVRLENEMPGGVYIYQVMRNSTVLGTGRFVVVGSSQ